MESERESERTYVYVVTDSSHDDYHIIAIFSDQRRRDADSYVDRFNRTLRTGHGELARVERWILDDPRMIALARSPR